jgi:hypothetical protein
MQNNKIKYKKIINNLIKKSFPELKNKKIYVFDLKSNGLFGISITFLPFFDFLGLNYSKLKNISDKALTGLIVHELCHFSIYEKRSFFENLKLIDYCFNPKRRRVEEKLTDELSIKKGYAKEIIESNKFILKNLDNKNKKIFKEFYLSPSQIKAYAKKIK